MVSYGYIDIQNTLILHLGVFENGIYLLTSPLENGILYGKNRYNPVDRLGYPIFNQIHFAQSPNRNPSLPSGFPALRLG